MAQVERPLSPHIQIYKPQLTSVLSILHRATGVALGAGAPLLAWWLLMGGKRLRCNDLIKPHGLPAGVWG